LGQARSYSRLQCVSLVGATTEPDSRLQCVSLVGASTDPGQANLQFLLRRLHHGFGIPYLRSVSADDVSQVPRAGASAILSVVCGPKKASEASKKTLNYLFAILQWGVRVSLCFLEFWVIPGPNFW
jgi:hypothetical protein